MRSRCCTSISARSKPCSGAARRSSTSRCTLADIALANELAHEVLGRSLDELPPQTRRVLAMIEEGVESEAKPRSLPRSDVRFTRRELRARCGMSDTAIRVHLERLVLLEYVRPVMGRNGQASSTSCCSMAISIDPRRR